MRVIGTAGHVDHGKSTLVQALTGTHPDRLKEEREREMTIDLGFAWMSLPKSDLLPEGEEVGIVDVPGHRDFIENMLAGVGGIDAALFVVAADEGVMPQTREHLSILDILQIDAGVVAMTKIDMVSDSDWLELVEDDIRHVLAGTVLEGVPIVRVSARAGLGLAVLKDAISACLAQRPPRLDLGKPRLPVDRVFTMPGFGTVVTGTLVDGILRVGEEVEILAGQRQGMRGRVRGLQSHKRKEDVAVPGSRTAVNISGLDVEDIQRGCVVTHVGDYRATRRIDVRFRLLPDASQSLRHSAEVKLFIGASERVARARLLGVEDLLPGAESWLQLELDAPVAVARGDRYILRRPSPGETLGGGVVVDPHPKGRHKRFSPEILQRLEALTQGSPGDVFFQALAVLSVAPLLDVIVRSGLEESIALVAAEELRSDGRLILPETDQPNLTRQALVANQSYWENLVQKTTQDLESFHRNSPLRKGIAKEELKSRLKLSPRIFNALISYLKKHEQVVEMGPLLAREGHAIRFNPAQQRQVETLLARFAVAPYAPPSVKDCIAEVKEDIFNALVELGELTLLPPDVVFRSQDYHKMVVEVRKLIQQNDVITAAQVRDHFNTSRRYILALLEHLDALGITVREGDFRRLKT